MPEPSPFFLEHVSRGALCGAVLGAGVCAVGWIVRQRNTQPIVLTLDRVTIPHTPHLLQPQHRSLAETLLAFRSVADVSDATRRIYAQLVANVETVAANADATGGKQVAVQRCVTRATACASQLAQAAFQKRHVSAFEAREQLEGLRTILGGMQQNMMLDG